MAVALRTAPGHSSGMPWRTPWKDDSISITSSRSCGVVGEAEVVLDVAKDDPVVRAVLHVRVELPLFGDEEDEVKK